jgi:hypothetical protein
MMTEIVLIRHEEDDYDQDNQKRRNGLSCCSPAADVGAWGSEAAIDGITDDLD